MALEEGGNMVMPVSPFGNNGGFGGDFGAWIILFLIFGMFGGNGWGGGYGNNALSYDFPWVLNGQQNTDALVSNGFQNAALQNSLTGIQSGITSGFGDVALGIAGINQNLCQTGNGITNAITQAQINAMQNTNALQSQLAQCCCDNRLATAQTQALVQSENCADRAALAESLRDVIENQTRNTQAILDKMCSQELEAERRENQNLRTQLSMRDLAASQTAQTAQLIADNNAQSQFLIGRIAPYPTPAYIVANPNTGCCGNTCGI